ncbi:hypothetical protein [Proteus phage RP7]|nr:hypothetical protein [Proteus phage RP7]
MSNPKFTRYISTAVSMGYLTQAGADIILALPVKQDAPSIDCAFKFADIVASIESGDLVVDARVLFDSVPRDIVERAYKALGEMASDNLLKPFDEMLVVAKLKENDSSAPVFALQFIDAVFTGVGHWNMYCKHFLEGLELSDNGVMPLYEESGAGEDPISFH